MARVRAYPTNQVIAILVSRSVAEATVSDLIAAGIPASAIETAYGAGGAGERGDTGKRPGVIVRIIGGVPGISRLAECKQRFEQALRRGECLLAVHAAEVLTRRLVYERLKARGARDINFFAPMKVVQFAP